MRATEASLASLLNEGLISGLRVRCWRYSNFKKLIGFGGAEPPTPHPHPRRALQRPPPHSSVT